MIQQIIERQPLLLKNEKIRILAHAQIRLGMRNMNFWQHKIKVFIFSNVLKQLFPGALPCKA